MRFFFFFDAVFKSAITLGSKAFKQLGLGLLPSDSREKAVRF